MKQPSSFHIHLTRVEDGEPTRALVMLDCDINCTVPVWTDPPLNAVTKRWGWDGSEGRPTITPSINCERCGWHKTIVNGVAT